MILVLEARSGQSLERYSSFLAKKTDVLCGNVGFRVGHLQLVRVPNETIYTKTSRFMSAICAHVWVWVCACAPGMPIGAAASCVRVSLSAFRTKNMIQSVLLYPKIWPRLQLLSPKLPRGSFSRQKANDVMRDAAATGSPMDTCHMHFVAVSNKRQSQFLGAFRSVCELTWFKTPWPSGPAGWSYQSRFC